MKIIKKSRAAVLFGVNQPFVIEDIEIRDPQPGEVLVHLAATGLCRTDYHLVTGDYTGHKYPVVCGHEGAGVVESVGPGVKRVKPGDQIILSALMVCGKCHFCIQGKSTFCSTGNEALFSGTALDGTYRVRVKGQEASQLFSVGTFSEWVTIAEESCVPVPRNIPLDKVGIFIGCGVITGFGSAVYRTNIHVGSSILVIGAGSVGMSAIQGARIAGAKMIVAADIEDFKLISAKKIAGATHTINAQKEDMVKRILEITGGIGVDAAVVTTAVLNQEIFDQAYASIRQGGRVVLVGLMAASSPILSINGIDLTVNQKEVVGSMGGGVNPLSDIPLLAELCLNQILKLEEMVSKVYPLERINEGFEDMLEGRIIRGVVNYGWWTNDRG